MADFPGPLSPDQLLEYERSRAYYGGAGISSSAATPPPTSAADFYGPPPPPPTGPVPLPQDPAAAVTPMGSQAPAPPPNASFETAPIGPPPPPTGPAPIPYDPRALSSSSMSSASSSDPSLLGTPGVNMSAVRQPISFERGPTIEAKPKPKATGPGNPDPFGVDKAYRGLRGTYDAEAAALQHGADAEKGRANLLADRGLDLARHKEEDAAIVKYESEEANRGFKEYAAETQRQLDAVREKRIDPGRLYADGGSKAMAVIGGLLGGMYQGMNRLSSNPFLDQMNRNIDRDIAVQEKNLAHEKESIAERRALLGDMRSIFKDEQLSKLQARNLYYEAAKEEIAAQAARFDDPLIQARADQGIAALNREQSKLDLQRAMQKAAEAKAAAAAKLAAEERARKAALEERAMRVQEGKLLVDAAEADAKGGGKAVESFVVTGQDPKTGAPMGFKARSPEAAEKIQESLTALDEMLDNIRSAKQIRTEEGGLNRFLFREGASGAYTPEWQSRLRSLEKEISVGWSRAKPGMGTYDNGIERLTGEIVGSLDSIGGKSDDKLEELERRTMAQRERVLRAHAGGEVVKTVDPSSGKEVVVPTGRTTAATFNQPGSSGIQHYDVNGNPIPRK